MLVVGDGGDPVFWMRTVGQMSGNQPFNMGDTSARPSLAVSQAYKIHCNRKLSHDHHAVVSLSCLTPALENMVVMIVTLTTFVLGPVWL